MITRKPATISKIATVALATTAFAVTACASKSLDLPPPPVVSPVVSTNAGGDTGEPTTTPIYETPVPTSQQDFIANISNDRIFFDYDQYNVDDQEDKKTLESQAAWLRRHPAVRILVGGHADERGTRDYNLALGERRANAARNHLVLLGVDSQRIDTISYGKERPAAVGSDERSWAQNRRAVTMVVVK